jgi:hypothetical protein
MSRTSVWFITVVSVAVIASSCAVSEERSGPGADGIPEILVACAEDQPDCQDTLTTGDLPTGGNDPIAPPTEPDGGSVSNGMVAEDGLSVADAIAYRGSEPVAVHGYVVRTSETTQLCETLAESFPPQCGGASLTLVNADTIDDLPLIEEGDVQWSSDSVILTGTVVGTELTIETTASA